MSITMFFHSAVFAHGHAGQLSGGPMLIYICCIQNVLMFKH